MDGEAEVLRVAAFLEETGVVDLVGGGEEVSGGGLGLLEGLVGLDARFGLIGVRGKAYFSVFAGGDEF